MVALQVGGGAGAVSVVGKAQAQGTHTLLTTRDATGHWLLALSPHSATLEVFPLDAEEGGGVQEAVHVETLTGKPSGVFVGPLPGAVYVLCGDTSRVLLYHLDQDSGALRLATTMSLSVDARGSALAFGPDMRYAYVLTRGGHVATFQVRPDASLVHSTHKSMASLVHLDITVGEGKGGEGVTVEPLGLSMSPSGRVLLASYSIGSGDTEEGYVAMLRVDGRSGAVQASQKGTVRAGTRPVGLAFDRDGSRAVVVDALAGPQEEANVRLLSVDEEKGALTQAGGVRVAGVPASAVFVSPSGEEQGKEG